MSRFFKRKKPVEEKIEVEEDESVDESVAEEGPATPEVSETEAKEVPVGRTSTIPYHASIQDRLMFMFNDPTIGAGIEGTDEFYLELMAMGERFGIGKAPLGKITIKSGAMADQDVHVRISNDAATELLSAANFAEFSKIFMHYYKTAEAGKFVKIEVRKPITDLNRRGYARVPILKLLIGSAR